MTKIFKTKGSIDLVYTAHMSPNSVLSCIVLLPGMPYNPLKKYDFIEDLCSRNDVYMIHYDGTWGSSGKFLEQSPAVSVDDFISGLVQGILLNCTGEAYKNVFVIGTSFGGGLALTIKDHSAIKAVCALSPVITYRSVHGIDTLGEYLKSQCAEHYTFAQEDMDALIADQVIVPDKQITLPTKKLLAFAGEYDDQIPVSDVQNFCSKNDITLHTIPIGHITLGKINSDIYQKMIFFFEKNIQ
jgi:pimeloyl-ACP methyl ester carboxylesterase